MWVLLHLWVTLLATSVQTCICWVEEGIYSIVFSHKVCTICAVCLSNHTVWHSSESCTWHCSFFQDHITSSLPDVGDLKNLFEVLLVPAGFIDWTWKELIWICMSFINSSSSVPGPLSAEIILAKLCFLPVWWHLNSKFCHCWLTGDVGWFYVHPPDIFLLSNLKVRVDLNGLSDVLIHIVPYRLTVRSFFYSVIMRESLNLAQ